jgi:hypothetical protein
MIIRTQVPINPIMKQINIPIRHLIVKTSMPTGQLLKKMKKPLLMNTSAKVSAVIKKTKVEASLQRAQTTQK